MFTSTIAECSDGMTINVARTIEEVEQLRNYWEKLQRHPNADIDNYLTVVKTLKEIIRPHVIFLSKDGVPTSIMIGRIENYPFECKVGYKTKSY